MMEEYDKIMPQYGFASNKGYGAAAHIEALKKYGPSPIHRNSFIGHFVRVLWGMGEISLSGNEDRRTTGARYEKLAAEYLEKQGLFILERNYRCRQGEIDLIARETEKFLCSWK